MRSSILLVGTVGLMIGCASVDSGTRKTGHHARNQRSPTAESSPLILNLDLQGRWKCEEIKENINEDFRARSESSEEGEYDVLRFVKIANRKKIGKADDTVDAAQLKGMIASLGHTQISSLFAMPKGMIVAVAEMNEADQKSFGYKHNMVFLASGNYPLTFALSPASESQLASKKIVFFDNYSKKEVGQCQVLP